MKVRILHAVDSRKAYSKQWQDWTPSDVRSALCIGEFYEAGEVETDADYRYDELRDRMDYSPILGEAFDYSQNDAHTGELNGFEAGMPKQGRPQWNGKFSQRSTQIGDLMVLEGGMVFQVRGCGYEYITSYRALNKLRGIKLAVNPNAINEDFDSLITD